MTEVIYSGNVEDMQKQMGKDEFSRAITMEGVSRAMNKQVMERLKLIGTGQPIPEETEEKAPEAAEASETGVEASEDVEEAVTLQEIDTEPSSEEENEEQVDVSEKQSDETEEEPAE
jgi:hypothetical protein